MVIILDRKSIKERHFSSYIKMIINSEKVSKNRKMITII
jgi:hypothetical protein